MNFGITLALKAAAKRHAATGQFLKQREGTVAHRHVEANGQHQVQRVHTDPKGKETVLSTLPYRFPSRDAAQAHAYRLNKADTKNLAQPGTPFENPDNSQNTDERNKKRRQAAGQGGDAQVNSSGSTLKEEVVFTGFSSVFKKDHPGFDAAARSIAARSGESMDNAKAMLAASSRNASAAAKKKNPRLKRV